MIPVWQLYKLQKLDSDLYEVTSYRDSLASGSVLAGKLDEKEREIKEIKDEINKGQIKIKDLELKVASLEEQKKNFENKLYSGKSSNSKELSSWQKEVEQLNKNKRDMEDEILSYLEAYDIKEQKKKKLEEEYGIIKQEYENFASDYKSQHEKSSNKIGELETSIKSLKSYLDEEALSLYEELFGDKDGLAVVKLEGENCGGCFINLPESVVKKVMKREFQTCPSCGRILVFDKT